MQGHRSWTCTLINLGLFAAMTDSVILAVGPGRQGVGPAAGRRAVVRVFSQAVLLLIEVLSVWEIVWGPLSCGVRPAVVPVCP